MANGPLGGNMGTPPVPPQPPQVSFETTAQSRGNFNSFLKSMPNTTAMTPLPPLGSASMMPAPNPMGNIDIFNEPMGMQFGSLPATYAEGGDVQNFFMGGSAMSGGGFSDADIGSQMDDFDSGEEDTSDSFDENMGLSEQEVEDIFSGGDDPAPPPLPTPRPEILKEAIGRAENQVFGDTEGDALGFFNKAGGLTETGQKEFDDAIMANLNILQEDPVDTGTTLASAGDITPASVVKASFRPDSLTPKTATTVLDDLDLNKPSVQTKSFVQSQPEGALKNTFFDYVPDAFQISNFLSQRGNQIPTGVAPVGTQGSRSRGDIISPQAEFNIANVFNDEDERDEVSERNLDRATGFANRGLEVDVDTTTGRPEIAPTVDNLLALGREAQAKKDAQTPYGFDLDALESERQISSIPQTIGIEVPSGFDSDLDAMRSEGATYDTIYDPETYTGPTKALPNTGMVGGRRDPFVPETMVEAGGMGIPAPKEFRDPFPNAGIGAIPTLTSLANKFSAYSRGRVLDSIAQKGYTPVMDGDVIVGAKDRFGNLMEGMDPNAPMGSDDNNENPFIIKPKEKEEEKEDKPPNVIGGIDIRPKDPLPLVVDSPFAPATSKIEPISFDSGQLNKLIELLTGVPAKPVVSAAEGGLIRAVDDFLAIGR